MFGGNSEDDDYFQLVQYPNQTRIGKFPDSHRRLAMDHIDLHKTSGKITDIQDEIPASNFHMVERSNP